MTPEAQETLKNNKFKQAWTNDYSQVIEYSFSLDKYVCTKNGFHLHSAGNLERLLGWLDHYNAVERD